MKTPQCLENTSWFSKQTITMLPSTSHLECTEQYQDISPAWSDVWAFSMFQLHDFTTYYLALCIMSWSRCQNLQRYRMVHTTIFMIHTTNVWPHWYLHLREGLHNIQLTYLQRFCLFYRRSTLLHLFANQKRLCNSLICTIFLSTALLVGPFQCTFLCKIEGHLHVAKQTTENLGRHNCNSFPKLHRNSILVKIETHLSTTQWNNNSSTSLGSLIMTSFVV